ncbi:MAG TPA: L,D-transpeptidase family protein [Caulobacteraceae bacterium]|nr:L,D-transpeptidase family protein [Caulobacteraceae bacterium]
MIFTARADGRFEFCGRSTRCALGPSGVVDAGVKREGDGASPAGVWPLRRVLYRADRRAPPITALPTAPIDASDGWCEAPADPLYNRQIRLSPGAPGDRLWRDDHLYDLLVVLGHNDDPVVAGAGSAIFLHLARPGYAPTRGCVALAPEDLEALLAVARPGDALAIRG